MRGVLFSIESEVFLLKNVIQKKKKKGGGKKMMMTMQEGDCQKREGKEINRFQQWTC